MGQATMEDGAPDAETSNGTTGNTDARDSARHLYIGGDANAKECASDSALTMA